MKLDEPKEFSSLNKLETVSPAQNVLVGMAKVMVLAAMHYIVKKKVKMFDPVITVAGSKGVSHANISAVMSGGPLGLLKHELLSAYLAHADADFYMIACEAWSLSKKASDTDLKEFERSYERGDIARSPNRISTFVLSGEGIEGDVFSGSWEIKELGHARLIDFDNPIDLRVYNRASSGGAVAQGAMHDLLDLRRTLLHEGQPLH